MRLQEQINKAGLLNKELAEKVGTDNSMMSRFVHFKCLPVPDDMEKICKILDCTVSDIYEDNEIHYKSIAKKKTKKETDKYKLTVSLPKDAQVFIKKALKKCGYRDITEWILKCYLRLKKQYALIEAYEKEKASHEEKPNVKNSLPKHI